MILLEHNSKATDLRYIVSHHLNRYTKIILTAVCARNLIVDPTNDIHFKKNSQCPWRHIIQGFKYGCVEIQCLLECWYKPSNSSLFSLIRPIRWLPLFRTWEGTHWCSCCSWHDGSWNFVDRHSWTVSMEALMTNALSWTLDLDESDFLSGWQQEQINTLSPWVQLLFISHWASHNRWAKPVQFPPVLGLFGFCQIAPACINIGRRQNWVRRWMTLSCVQVNICCVISAGWYQYQVLSQKKWQ